MGLGHAGRVIRARELGADQVALEDAQRVRLARGYGLAVAVVSTFGYRRFVACRRDWVPQVLVFTRTCRMASNIELTRLMSATCHGLAGIYASLKALLVDGANRAELTVAVLQALPRVDSLLYLTSHAQVPSVAFVAGVADA